MWARPCSLASAAKKVFQLLMHYMIWLPVFTNPFKLPHFHKPSNFADSNGVELVLIRVKVMILSVSSSVTWPVGNHMTLIVHACACSLWFYITQLTCWVIKWSSGTCGTGCGSCVYEENRNPAASQGEGIKRDRATGRRRGAEGSVKRLQNDKSQEMRWTFTRDYKPALPTLC